MRTLHLSATWQARTTCTSTRKVTKIWRLLYMPQLTREKVFLLLALLLQEPKLRERSNNTSGGDSWAPWALRDPSSLPRHTTTQRGAGCTPTKAGEGGTEYLSIWSCSRYPADVEAGEGGTELLRILSRSRYHVDMLFSVVIIPVWYANSSATVFVITQFFMIAV